MALLICACQGERKVAPAAQGVDAGPQMVLSNNDTTTVWQMSSDFLDLLRAGNLDEAVSTLYMLDGEEVRPLPDDRKAECTAVLGLYPVYDYSIDELIFYKETDSEVKYTLVIQDPSTTSSPATMKGTIRPVRRGDMWYITLANSETETRRSELDD